MKRRDWLHCAASGLGAALAGRGILGQDLPPRIPALASMGGGGFPIQAVALSPDGTLLAAAELEQPVFTTWTADDGRERVHFPAHRGPVQALAFGRRGDRVISAAPAAVTAGEKLENKLAKNLRFEDPVLRSWEAATGRPQREFRGAEGSILDLATTSDGVVVALDGAYHVRAWRIADAVEVFMLKGPATNGRRSGLNTGLQSRFGVSADGRRAVALNTIGGVEGIEHRERTVSLWDADAGTHRVLDAEIGALWSVALSPDGALVVVGSFMNWVKAFEFTTGRRVFQFDPGDLRTGPRAIAFSADGARLAIGNEEGVVRIYETKEGRHRQAAWGPKGFIRAMSFLQDRLRVVSGGFASTGFVQRPTGGGFAAHEPLSVWDIQYKY